MRSSLIRPLTSSFKTCTPRTFTRTPILPIHSIRVMSSGIPSETAKIQKEAENQQTAGVPSASELGIENTNIKTATGISLSDEQKIIVGSVLDLFAGRPSLKKLQLWKDDALFQDNITKAEGRAQYEPQWYGLQSAFSSIERLSQSVTSSGNPIEMDMSTKYKLKGTGNEKTINSKIRIFIEGGKISQVQDRWDGELPDGVFATAMRNLNSVVVPKVVGVPKNEEEDRKRGN